MSHLDLGLIWLNLLWWTRPAVQWFSAVGSHGSCKTPWILFLRAEKTHTERKYFTLILFLFINPSFSILETPPLVSQLLTHCIGGNVLFTDVSHSLSSSQDISFRGKVKHLCSRAWTWTSHVSLKSCLATEEPLAPFWGTRGGQDYAVDLGSRVCTVEHRRLPTVTIGDHSLAVSLCHFFIFFPLQDTTEARHHVVTELGNCQRG